MLLVLAGVYCVPMYVGSHLCGQCICVVHARDFRLHVNLQKMRVHGCAHVERLFLLAGTAHASVKFKLSCTVYQFIYTIMVYFKNS